MIRVLLGSGYSCGPGLNRGRSAAEDVIALQIARLVGGVATTADDAGLDEAEVRPMLEVLADGLLT